MIDHPIYNSLFTNIVSTYLTGKTKAVKAVNAALIETYWKIGQHIVQFEQEGNSKAEYGDGLLQRLSKDLSLNYGKGFSLSNIKRFRQFYLLYPKGATVSHLLGAENRLDSIGAEAPHLFDIDNQLDTKGAEAPHLLSWTHYVELLKIDNPIERSFYEKQCITENWSTTELIRQKKTSLFLRLAAGKNKNQILKLSRQGQIIEKP